MYAVPGSTSRQRRRSFRHSRRFFRRSVTVTALSFEARADRHGIPLHRSSGSAGGVRRSPPPAASSAAPPPSPLFRSRHARTAMESPYIDRPDRLAESAAPTRPPTDLRRAFLLPAALTAVALLAGSALFMSGYSMGRQSS